MMQVYGLTDDQRGEMPRRRPPAPDIDAVIEQTKVTRVHLRRSIELFEALGRPRAHVDRLHDAEYVLEALELRARKARFQQSEKLDGIA